MNDSIPRSKSQRFCIVSVIALASGIVGGGAPLDAQTPFGIVPSITGDSRVDRLLGQMTLEEKINLLHGGSEETPSGVGQGGTWPGVPRLAIPSLRFADGPQGVDTRIWSTGMPSTMTLASTWSRSTATINGQIIGSDARALGQDVSLQPFINIVRDFDAARSYNTFGEDPFLTGQIAAAEIQGIQQQGVMATAKHLVGYDGGGDVYIGGQALREIYMAPFADAVDSGVASIMCAYNKINGENACNNNMIQNIILRGENHFDGFIISDWGGDHGTVSISHGLDLEMPIGSYSALAGGGTGLGITPPPGGGARTFGLMPEEEGPSRSYGFVGGAGTGVGEYPPAYGVLKAIRDGLLTQTEISQAAGRILLQMDRFGFLDNPPDHRIHEIDYAAHAASLRKTAEDGAVLLKNENGILPLSSEDLSRTILVGATSVVPVSIGLMGEKGAGLPDHQESPAHAIRRISGQAVLAYPGDDFDGRSIDADHLSNVAHAGDPLGKPGAGGPIDYTLENGNALAENGHHRWTATLSVPKTGRYVLALQTRGASAKLSIDGAVVIGDNAIGSPPAFLASGDNAPALTSLPGLKGLHPASGGIATTHDHLNNQRKAMTLSAGRHAITIDAKGENLGQEMQVRLAWTTPDSEALEMQRAIAAAKRATKVVIFAWSRSEPAVFHLPGNQDDFIERIAAVNPNTIVVLNTALPVALPWLDKVRAVLQMWYPGDEGGAATAELLLGRANPGGRLPITWPVSQNDMVAQDPTHHPDRTSKIEGITSESEGIFMGYRWFDQQKIAPLFPFGYGLSYARFTFSKLTATPAPDGGYNVDFHVANTGARPADEVAQVYIGPPEAPPAGSEFAIRQLVQFDRITLRPGESRAVQLHVEPRRLQYWSDTLNRWQTPKGARKIYVGRSSRDLPLETEIGRPEDLNGTIYGAGVVASQP